MFVGVIHVINSFQDKDGFITIEEFRAYHAKTNKDQTAVEKAFAAIDADKNGLVTFEGSGTTFFFFLQLKTYWYFIEFERAYKD